MRAVELVVAVIWAVFWLYWLTAAFSMKRGRVPWSRELGIRAVIVVVVILLVRVGVFRHLGRNARPWRAGLGLALLALGLGCAIWARLHIGRNWGMPMTQKNEPELVSSGPYRLVRHPIYSQCRGVKDRRLASRLVVGVSRSAVDDLGRSRW